MTANTPLSYLPKKNSTSWAKTKWPQESGKWKNFWDCSVKSKIFANSCQGLNCLKTHGTCLGFLNPSLRPQHEKCCWHFSKRLFFTNLKILMLNRQKTSFTEIKVTYFVCSWKSEDGGRYCLFFLWKRDCGNTIDRYLSGNLQLQNNCMYVQDESVLIRMVLHRSLTGICLKKKMLSTGIQILCFLARGDIPIEKRGISASEQKNKRCRGKHACSLVWVFKRQ